MNIILFPIKEDVYQLPSDDQRYAHITQVLKMKQSDELFVGAVNGPLGKANITSLDNAGLELTVTWFPDKQQLHPVHFLVGLPRPQTARKILTEITALGAKQIMFFGSEKGEPGYAQSSLWSSGEWERLIRQGTEQAFATHLPEVSVLSSLQEVLERIPENNRQRIALDVYEATTPMGSFDFRKAEPIVIAIGSERGWSSNERDLLRSAKFTLCHLGERVLRTETAAVTAAAVALTKTGVF